LHAIIYGTGKWAQLLKIKLKSLGLSPILIGNNPLVADYNRAKTPHIAKAFWNAPVFIASATKDHFVDMVHSKMFDPSIIFVEKGFINAEEKASATSWAADRKIPVYILSQYRYSKVLEILESFKDDIISILHDWTIDKGTISEWVYHIMSIDNYIKNSNNQFYTYVEGSHIIDRISNFRIVFGNSRELKTIIKTKDETIVLNFGTTNSIHIKNTYGVDAYSSFQNEDCITSQLKDIIKNTENLRLERL
jgi:hypothetical protein